MIRPLRKRHLQVWSLWAVLLPLGIIGAALSRKNIPADDSLEQAFINEFPVLIKEKISEGYIVRLRRDGSYSIQLAWTNKKPLEVPTAAIYLADSDTASINAAQYIGRIEGRGNYYFNLPSSSAHNFILYDFIHQQIIDRINL